jgi:hypothetical protein
MSRALRLSLVLSGIGAPLLAQAPTQRLAARADSLAALWQEARAMADLSDSLAHAVAPPVLDTIVAGSLRVIINPSPLPIQAAADGAWHVLDSVFGSAARRFSTTPIGIIAVEPDSVPRTTPSYRGQEVRWDIPEDELRQILLAIAPVPQPDSLLLAWLTMPVTALVRESSMREAAYVQLVAAPSTVVRQCYRGDFSACTIALGLDPASDHAVTWYVTPQERQSVVEGASFIFQNSQSEPDLQRCRIGVDSACIALLRRMAPSYLTRPLDGEARRALLLLALSAGGRDAYERMLTHPGVAPAEQLAVAAGEPMSRLITQWRDSIFAARPRPITVSLTEVVAGFAWILGFAGLAFRSTRWRVG